MNVTLHFLNHLKPQLSDRDLAIIETVGRFKLATAEQLERLFFAEHDQDGRMVPYSDKSRSRNRQAVLKRLTDNRVLARVGDRAIGGANRGSLGFLYALDVAGQAIGQFTERPRRPYVSYDPSIEHYLAITRLYVELVEADRAGMVKLLKFDTEPYCHRTFGHRVLKPDAFVQLGFERDGQRRKRSFFIEIDRGSQYGTKITTKVPQYLAYNAYEDREGVFPLVVLLTRTGQRVSYLGRMVQGMGDQQRLFKVARLDYAVAALSG